MTSTPVNLLSLRSGLNSDRPKPTTLQLGQIAVNYGASEPGIYLEDTGGAVRKIGPNHYGTTAPNSVPAGQTGNSVGETWVDSSTSSYFLKVWTGSTWQTIGSAFATSAAFATAATSAVSAGSAIVASGAIFASGSYSSDIASGCIVASGAIFASGSYSSAIASGCIVASGAIFASGSYSSAIASGCIVASGIPVATGLPASSAEGTLIYQAAAVSGLYIYVGGQWVAV